MTRLGAALLVLLAAAPAALAQEPVAEIVLEDVTVERQQDGVFVRLRTSAEPRHEAQWLDRPPRIIVDLADTRNAWKLSRLPGPADPVREIRGSQLRRGVARVVIELSTRVDYRIDAEPGGLRVAFATPQAGAAPGPAAEWARPPGTQPPGPRRPQLFGVVHGNRGWVAYIEDPDSKRVSSYRVGDSLGSSVVERIEAESVTLVGPQGSVLLQLGDGRPGLPAATR